MATIASVKKEARTEKNSKNRNAGADQQPQIEKLAYQFFVERGFQHGYDREDWFKAEQIVHSK